MGRHWRFGDVMPFFSMRPRSFFKASSFARQRINKSGTYTAPQGQSFYQATGWVSDTTYPCTVGTNSMVVSGTNPTATLTWNLPGTGTGIQFKRNGTIIAGNSSTARSSSATVSVSNGDIITCEVMSNFYPQATITSGYFELS